MKNNSNRWSGWRIGLVFPSFSYKINNHFSFLNTEQNQVHERERERESGWEGEGSET